jgi:hypothetical protein
MRTRDETVEAEAQRNRGHQEKKLFESTSGDKSEGSVWFLQLKFSHF